jgi:cation diffusion facilitator family transporter
MENADRNKLGYGQGILSIFINTLLFGLKYWAGIVSMSVAIIADAWHTLSDTLSSVVLVIGIKLSSKKADRKHPFGYGRWEQITAIFIGFMLAVVAYEFTKSSIEKFKNHESANFGTIAIIVTITSIIVKELLAQYAFWIGRKTGILAVKADGWHHRSDALSSIVVLAGIFLGKYFWWIDSLMGILVSLMLLYAVFEIIKSAINKLLGEEPSDELIGEINSIITSSVNHKVFPHHFHVHNYGIHQELTFHLMVEDKLDIKTAHALATSIEKSIFERLKIDTTIHIEPLADHH